MMEHSDRLYAIRWIAREGTRFPSWMMTGIDEECLTIKKGVDTDEMENG